MWGTWWIPLRQLDQAGVGSTWANAAPMFLPLVILLPFVVARWRRIATGGWQVYAAGFLIAAVVALYAEGLLRGQVARVVLLFYLTPVWSAIGGRIFLGIPITHRRMLTIVLGLTGMAIVFGVDAGLPMPTNIAEWMALISGILWAGGLVILHRIESVPLLDKTFVQFLFLGIIYLGLSSIPGGGSWSFPVFDNIGPAIFWIAALALCWVLPVMFLSLYAAGKIDPAKVSILLTLEVVIGITTAALLTDEPFGLREGVGAVLIVAAGLMEFTFVPKRNDGAGDK
jgi:drug/metabolite transporter (DMT)-like permease